jgi:hypothetical protein
MIVMMDLEYGVCGIGRHMTLELDTTSLFARSLNFAFSLDDFDRGEEKGREGNGSLCIYTQLDGSEYTMSRHSLLPPFRARNFHCGRIF